MASLRIYPDSDFLKAGWLLPSGKLTCSLLFLWALGAFLQTLPSCHIKTQASPQKVLPQIPWKIFPSGIRLIQLNNSGVFITT